MKSEFVNYLQQDSILMLDGKTKKEVLEEIISYGSALIVIISLTYFIFGIIESFSIN